MKDAPDVWVVIATYNRGAFAGNLDSVLWQEFQDFEVTVVGVRPVDLFEKSFVGLQAALIKKLLRCGGRI